MRFFAEAILELDVEILFGVGYFWFVLGYLMFLEED